LIDLGLGGAACAVSLFLCIKTFEVMAVKLEERLSKKQKQQLERMKSPKRKEQISKKELNDLMKPSTPILHRKRGGAWGN
jgi:hypothetical protein